jgi:hypothetical protein
MGIDQPRHDSAAMQVNFLVGGKVGIVFEIFPTAAIKFPSIAIDSAGGSPAT